MQKYGIMIMSGFAATWFVWGLSALRSIDALWLLVPLAISGTMMALALRIPVVASDDDRKEVGRIVGWASGIEGVAILIAVNVVTWMGYPGLTVCAVLAIVGLHFLPLAYFLRVRSDYLVGAALVALAGAGAAIPSDSTRLLVLGVGAAVLLWLNCLARFARKPAGTLIAA